MLVLKPVQLRLCWMAVLFPSVVVLFAEDSTTVSYPHLNCGLNSLRALMSLTGAPLAPGKWVEVARAFSAETLSMKELRQAASALGYPLKAWQMTAEELGEAGLPAILHLREQHFCTFIDSVGGLVRSLDEGGRVRVSGMKEFSEHFSGYCLLPEDRQPRPRPVLVLKEVHHDLGEVHQDAVQHHFVCQNRGETPLRVKAAPLSPQVEVALASDGILQPGQSATITLKGNALRHRAVYGAKVLTDDPSVPVQCLTLSYRVPVPVTFAPARVVLRTRRGVESRGHIIIRGPADLEILDATTTDPGVIALAVPPAFKDDPDQGKIVRFPITAGSHAPAGKHTCLVTIKINDPRKPVISIPVEVEVTGFVSRTPRMAFFGFVPQGKSPVQQIVLACTQQPDFAVLGVKCALAGVEVQKPVQLENGRWSCVVRVRPSAPTGIIEGAVVIETNVPGEEGIEFPVYAHLTE